MAIGGPAAFSSSFMSSFERAQQHARARAKQQEQEQRYQLREALRFQREERVFNEHIARENLTYKQAQAAAERAQEDLDLLMQREQHIKSSQGAPFRDAALEGHLYEAQQRRDNAHAAMQESQSKFRDLVAARDERIRASIPSKSGGVLGFWQHDTTDEERRKATEEAEKADTPENREFQKSESALQKRIEKEKGIEQAESAKAGGLEKSIEAGKQQQQAINEEKKESQLYSMDKEAAALRDKKQSALEAAATSLQEIQSNQRNILQDQQESEALQANRGSTMGKAGGGLMGGGGGHGILGRIMGKGGGMGGPGMGRGPSMGVASMGRGPIMQGQGQGQSMIGPNLMQAPPGRFQGPIDPMIGRISQMPVPRAVELARTLLGQAIGGGRTQPNFGAPTSFAGPRAPIRVPPPSVGMEGRGGGLTPQANELAIRDALTQRGYSPSAQAAILGNIKQESNFDSRLNTRGGDSGSAHGLFQWRGDRLNNLMNYSKGKGLDPSSPGAQVGFMDQEVAGMPGLKQRLNQSDPSSGAMLFGKKFERPKVVESSRARNAEQFFKSGASEKPKSEPGVKPQEGKPDSSKMPINEKHIDFLKKNPKLAPAFNEKFGHGAAEKILGGGDL